MKLNLIENFVKERLKAEKTGHDYYHGKRVANLALKMYLADNPNAHLNSRMAQIIQAAGLLHDAVDEKICADPAQVLIEIRNLLSEAEFERLEIADIIYSIQHLSFAKNIEQHYQLPLSGQYVQDADRLESLGAIGIARAFTYGGKYGDKIYDPEIKPHKLLTHKQYRNQEKTTINHFYEKLLQLVPLMNTTSGKKEAKRRTKFMENYLEEFFQEWNV